MKRERRKELAAKLRLVRAFTSGFEASAGYHAGRKMSGGKARAVDLYFDRIKMLQAKPTQSYTPKPHERREAFEYTGQTGFRKFKKAIVYKPDVKATYEFEIEKTRPVGSQFVAVNKKTRQRFYHIPAKAFADDLDLEGVELSEFYQQVLEDYAADAELYIIQAGESYMWGSAGSQDAVAEKIALIKQNYSSRLFDANKKSSSYYGNWFKGVTAFTDRFDVLDDIGRGRRNQRLYREKYHLGEGRVRRFKDGSLALMVDGEIKRRYFRIGPDDWEE